MTREAGFTISSTGERKFAMALGALACVAVLGSAGAGMLHSGEHTYQLAVRAAEVQTAVAPAAPVTAVAAVAAAAVPSKRTVVMERVTVSATWADVAVARAAERTRVASQGAPAPLASAAVIAGMR